MSGEKQAENYELMKRDIAAELDERLDLVNRAGSIGNIYAERARYNGEIVMLKLCGFDCVVDKEGNHTIIGCGITDLFCSWYKRNNE